MKATAARPHALCQPSYFQSSYFRKLAKCCTMSLADDVQLGEPRGGAAPGALRVEVVGVNGAGVDQDTARVKLVELSESRRRSGKRYETSVAKAATGCITGMIPARRVRCSRSRETSVVANCWDTAA